MDQFEINSHHFLEELPRDLLTPSLENTSDTVMRTPRMVKKAAYSLVRPEGSPDPDLGRLYCVALHDQHQSFQSSVAQ
jgi:hypothetical protein